jgi:hypothetical protein
MLVQEWIAPGFFANPDKLSVGQRLPLIIRLGAVDIIRRTDQPGDLAIIAAENGVLLM